MRFEGKAYRKEQSAGRVGTDTARSFRARKVVRTIHSATINGYDAIARVSHGRLPAKRLAIVALLFATLVATDARAQDYSPAVQARIDAEMVANGFIRLPTPSALTYAGQLHGHPTHITFFWGPGRGGVDFVPATDLFPALGRYQKAAQIRIHLPANATLDSLADMWGILRHEARHVWQGRHTNTGRYAASKNFQRNMLWSASYRSSQGRPLIPWDLTEKVTPEQLVGDLPHYARAWFTTHYLENEAAKTKFLGAYLLNEIDAHSVNSFYKADSWFKTILDNIRQQRWLATSLKRAQDMLSFLGGPYKELEGAAVRQSAMAWVLDDADNAHWKYHHTGSGLPKGFRSSMVALDVVPIVAIEGHGSGGGSWAEHFALAMPLVAYFHPVATAVAFGAYGGTQFATSEPAVRVRAQRVDMVIDSLEASRDPSRSWYSRYFNSLAAVLGSY